MQVMNLLPLCVCVHFLFFYFGKMSEFSEGLDDTKRLGQVSAVGAKAEREKE
jgi:hypothetical protein